MKTLPSSAVWCVESVYMESEMSQLTRISNINTTQYTPYHSHSTHNQGISVIYLSNLAIDHYIEVIQQILLNVIIKIFDI